MQVLARGTIRQPTVVVVATAEGEDLVQLLGARGFSTTRVASVAELRTDLGRRDETPIAAIIDFRLDDSRASFTELENLTPRPILLGIGAGSFISARLDGAFNPPIDAGRLFARLAILVGERKQARKNRGVSGTVRGNPLFQLVEQQLWVAVPPSNAGMVLERALEQLGTNPQEVCPQEIAAMLATGQLLDALRPFGDPEALRASLDRVIELLAKSSAR